MSKDKKIKEENGRRKKKRGGRKEEGEEGRGKKEGRREAKGMETEWVMRDCAYCVWQGEWMSLVSISFSGLFPLGLFSRPGHKPLA